MKYTELDGKTAAELETMLKEKKTEFFTLKMKKKLMQLTNTTELKIARKSIARINTAISAINKQGA